MHYPNHRRQTPDRTRATAVSWRLDAARETRCAAALLALLALASLSVMATTTSLSRAHADRIAATLQH